MSHFDIRKPVVGLPEQDPAPQIPEDDLVWTDDEAAMIERFRAQYPEPEAAIMKVLWLAQEKFGWLPPEVIKLCADSLDMSAARAYGVATFYTQYYKEKPGTHTLDVCTSYSCQVMGGYDILHYIEDTLGIHDGETTEDGAFTLQGVECLGCCGSAPMLQVTNGPYVHHLTEAKVDALIDDLRAGHLPPFTSITLPQDEDEMGGNRRSDAEHVEAAQTPPVAEHME
jgi:NADH-quinone oxidoreductase subunit E